jgi:hypothetical protein
MGLVKDLYMDEVERRAAEPVDQGVDPADAYDAVTDAAYIALGDRLADMADNARMRAKEGN